MKKFLVGCLIVLVVAMAGFAVAGYYAYRWAQPMIQNTANYLDRAREMSRLGDRVTNKTPYLAPANGELTQSQIERYLAVQARVRDELGARLAEIDAKSAAIREKTKDGRQLTFTELTTVVSDLAGLYVEARREQVNALNVHKFSDAEYTWVRLRAYEAAGMEITSGIDFAQIEQMASDSGVRVKLETENIPKPKVPDVNRKLVKPHLAKLKDGFALAFLGL